MSDLDEIQKRLKSIAEVVNAFKSESVQLRVVEVLIAELGVHAPPAAQSNRDVGRKIRRKSTIVNKESGDGGDTKTTKMEKKATRTSGSPGAFAMITQLLADGFFKTPKTIGAIVTHCGTSKGHHYKANECSPPLLRLLRDVKLKREKNKDGQYEYVQA